MSPWLQLVGRLHPLLVHLPIGALLVWGLLEAVAWRTGRALDAALARALAWLCVAAATASATSGWLRFEDLEESNALAWRHRLLGLSLTAVLLVLALLQERALRSGSSAVRRAQLAALLLALALLGPTGHLGASLVHGSDFLLAPWRRAAQVPGPSIAEAPSAGEADEAAASGVVLVEDMLLSLPPGPAAGGPLAAEWPQIAAILRANCSACHGEKRRKGDLALHDYSAVFEGGLDGPVVLPGDARNSELLRRLRLPLDDEDHMPPPEKPQPSADEIERIDSWIAAGARYSPETQPPASQGTAATVSELALQETAQLAPADPQALAALRAAFVHAEQLSARDVRLWIDFSGAPSVDDAQLEALLAPLTGQIAELGLARTAISDAAMATLARCTLLERLDLGSTAVGDEGLQLLSALPALERLVLSGTRVGSAGLAQLARFPALKEVHLWGSAADAEAIAALRSARPELVLRAGDDLESAALEAETDVQPGTQDGAPKGDVAPGAEAPVAAATAINERCPVSGALVDIRYTVQFEGRTIGFCCPNCPKQFLADPEAFRAKL